MNYKPIVPGSTESSVLIFGCAGLMGRVDKKASMRAVALALEHGISHFDAARSYGYGEAEGCLGEALQGCRRQVVITSKFGLLPSSKGAAVRFLKPIAQSLLRAFPGARGLLRKGVQSAGAGAVKGQFDLKTSTESLETSLRELKTHYIDLLLMHDCGEDDVTDGLVEFLESLKRTGKIRAYGAAAGPETAKAIEARYPGQFLFQLPDSVTRRSRNSWTPKKPFLTYGLLHRAKQVFQWAKEDPEGLRINELGFLEESNVFELMLQYGLLANPSGAVICSMLNPIHLEANLRVVESPRFSPDQVEAFGRWIVGKVEASKEEF
jgi:hypothetical protein